MSLSRRAAAAILAVYLLTLAFIVFWPTQQLSGRSIEGMTSAAHDLGAPPWFSGWEVGFAANVLLFVPLSFCGSVFRPQWGWVRWTVAGLVAGVAIELGQMVLLPGRMPTAADALANTTGALGGYLLAVVLLRNRAAADEPAPED